MRKYSTFLAAIMLTAILTVFSNCTKSTDPENNGNEPINTDDTIVPEGAINGRFTIDAKGNRVYFSKGNLRYQASNDIWKFAENQWEYIGDTNSNISSTYNGWIDLFGWGTSGNDHGAVCYQPWSNSCGVNDYFAYGNENCNLYDQTGKADWGCNHIANGGDNQWRTLTKEEWVYIFDCRNTISGIRYAKASINGVNGIILVPDNWVILTYNLINTDQYNASYSSNTISQSEWSEKLESAGCVFLPATGFRSGAAINYPNDYAGYWSSTSCSNYFQAYRVYFYHDFLTSAIVGNKYEGYSVRLVSPIP